VEARLVCAVRKTLVLADGDHAADHVLEEIRLYAPLISEGSYFIAEDGIVDVMGWKQSGPAHLLQRSDSSPKLTNSPSIDPGKNSCWPMHRAVF
jgi:cephalosporin hydroxylase